MDNRRGYCVNPLCINLGQPVPVKHGTSFVCGVCFNVGLVKEDGEVTGWKPSPFSPHHNETLSQRESVMNRDARPLGSNHPFSGDDGYMILLLSTLLDPAKSEIRISEEAVRKAEGMLKREIPEHYRLEVGFDEPRDCYTVSLKKKEIE